jgi:neurotransmitter:Na+ symporter, NSS family
MAATARGAWGSKLGFILAASGSAIGLGNIVFFGANAYKYGAGAFYLPYLMALVLIGIPLMILELGLGRMTGQAFPLALRQIGGKRGEFFGWFAVLNAGVITMYYITILGWVVGMLLRALGPLWATTAVPAFGLDAGVLSNSMSHFFDMISRYEAIAFVVLVWLLNAFIVLWGTKSIESVVKVFVPAMWLFMLVLIFRGLTLENGLDGVYLLFTPNWSVMKDPDVWLGAMSQIFFTLSLGFGIMSTYASYLPKKNDDVQSALTISLMNCGFEYIAGVAIFALLFAFAVVPKASTIGMMFFVVPEGIAQMPFWVRTFGFLFFLLLLTAGLTSAVSLVETVVSSIIDAFKLQRKKVVVAVALIGAAGSITFAAPQVIDSGLNSDGTLGLTLLDLFDHWAFSYGLLLGGLIECVFLGWFFDTDKLIAHVNKHAVFKLGPWFKWMIRFFLPAAIIAVLGSGVYKEITDGVYGHDFTAGPYQGWIHLSVLATWLTFTLGGATVLMICRGRAEKGGGR